MNNPSCHPDDARFLSPYDYELASLVPREPNGRKSRRNNKPTGRPRIDPDKLANGQPEIRFRVSREVMERIKNHVSKIDGLCVAEFAKSAFLGKLDRVERASEADLEEIGGRR